MKINTKLHGVFDYIFAIALIIPWFINYCNDHISFDLMAITGLLLLFINQFTKYEFGLIRLIPLKIHLIADFISAMFLFLLPFCFSYPNNWPLLFSMIQQCVIFFSLTPAKR